MFRKSALLCLLLVTAPLYADQNVVVVLDDSGSMNERLRGNRRLTKMKAAKDALATVLDGLPADTKLGIMLLNGGRGSGHWVYPLAPVDTAALKAGIQQIGASGGTPLGERMKEGCDTLLALRDEEHYGSYRLLIVTDGEATDGKLVEKYLPDILSRGIWVGVIGVDMAGTHSLATKVHTYRRADNPQALVEAIREFMAEYDDAGGADQLDVELLAAIPDEVATAALEALSEPRNHPIGAQPSVAPPRRQQEGRPGVQEAEPGEQGIGFLGCCCWGVVVLFIVVAFVCFVRAASKPKRS